MNYSAYPKYRQSGVEWLGEVPEHWSTRRLKSVAATPIKNGVGEPGTFDIPNWPRYIRITDIAGPRQLRDETFASLPPEVAREAPVGVGDILLAAVGASYGKSYLHVKDIGPACFAGFMVRFSPGPALLSEFAAYWTESAPYWALIQSRVVQSTIQNFSAGKYRELELPLPPVPEQRAIVAFLDRATARIDELIVEQQRLIDLLMEKRQAVIYHAVTKGLNPDAVMKPSGIDWIGDVPVAWTLERLPSICDFIPGKAHEPFMNDDGIHLCVTSRFVSTEGANFKRCSDNLSPARKNDTLVVMSDLPNGRALGKAFFVADEKSYAVNQRVCILRPFAVAPKYLYYLVNRSPELLRHDDGANQTHLSNADFLKPRFPVPPLAEQAAITLYLDRESDRFDVLASEAQAAMSLLQQRRTALISAAVTGKIDVRHLADAEAA